MVEHDYGPNQQTVEPIEVARYYLASELGRLAEKVGHTGFQADTQSLDEDEVWNLIEGLSVQYRLNTVFWIVANPNYTWSRQEVAASDIYMTGMGRNAISELIYSEKIQNNPLKLRDYLRSYFSAHPHDDPENIGDLRPRPDKVITNDTLLIRNTGEELRMLDGSHRFVELLLRGKQTYNSYIAKPKSMPANIPPVAGAGTLWTLKRLLATTTDTEMHKSITDVAILLAQNSGKAEEDIRTTWVTKSSGVYSTDTTSEAGRMMLQAIANRRTA